MAQPAQRDASVGSVTAQVNFIVETGEKPVAYIYEAGERPTERDGEIQEHPVTIRDARALAATLGLEREGFVLVPHRTAVEDFYDDDQVRAVYYPEIEALVKDCSGAERVFVFDHTIRAAAQATRSARRVREPVPMAHNDYTEKSGPQRVRDFLPDEAEALLRRRFAVIQVWRSIAGPVRQWPLAICDAQSIPPADLIETDLKYGDRTGEVQQLKFNPEHRWYYFPDMTPDEAMVFKCYDSLTDGRARFTAHSAFDDPNTPPDAPERVSIEMRTLAFF